MSPDLTTPVASVSKVVPMIFILAPTKSWLRGVASVEWEGEARVGVVTSVEKLNSVVSLVVVGVVVGVGVVGVVVEVVVGVVTSVD